MPNIGTKIRALLKEEFKDLTELEFCYKCEEVLGEEMEVYAMRRDELEDEEE